jgi:hypothetical protein
MGLAKEPMGAHHRKMEPSRTPVIGAEPTSWVDVVVGSAASIAMGSVAGGVAGFVWGGVGGRIAMRVIFLTSDERVRGITSDDGFEIGRISFETVFLLIALTIVGAFLGAGYGVLRMFLKGPLWVVAAGMGVMVGAAGGALVVNADGIDFRFLEPLSLAVVMFVALPALWGATVPVLAERFFSIRKLFPGRLVGVDAKPFGRVGSIVGWGAVFALTVLGVVDLVTDLSRLN